MKSLLTLLPGAKEKLSKAILRPLGALEKPANSCFCSIQIPALTATIRWAGALLPALLCLIPGGYLLLRGLEIDWPHFIAINPPFYLAKLISTTAVLTITVTFCATALGTYLAWALHFHQLAYRKFWRITLILPLAVPSYVSAYTWVSRFNAEGLIPAITILTLCTYPYAFLLVSAALSRIDPDHIGIGHSLGISPKRCFFRLIWPQIRPAIGSASLIVSTYVLADFGALAMLRVQVFTRAIYDSYNAGFNRTTPAALAFLLFLVSFALSGTEVTLRPRYRAIRTSFRSLQQHCAYSTSVSASHRSTFLFITASLITILFALIAPIASTIGWIATSAGEHDQIAKIGSIFFSTITTATMGAALTVVAVIPLAWLGAKHRSSTVAKILEAIIYQAHGLPGIAVALAFIFLGIRIVPALYHTIWLLLGCYLVLYASVVIGPLHQAFTQLDPTLGNVGASLGQKPTRIWLRIWIPLTAPGFVTAFALGALTIMKELPGTLLLRPAGFETLATRMWSLNEELAYGPAAPYALCLIIIAIPLALAVATRK